MSDAPEQIYAWPSYGENSAAGVWGVTRYPEYAVKYVRADLYETLQARVAELEAQRDDCDKYLKPDETPRQRMDRDHADVLSLMKLLEREKYKLEAARDKALEEAAKVAEPIGWGVAAAIRAMKRGHSHDQAGALPKP